MDEQTIDLQAEEDILIFKISDDSLERAGDPPGLITFNSFIDICGGCPHGPE